MPITSKILIPRDKMKKLFIFLLPFSIVLFAGCNIGKPQTQTTKNSIPTVKTTYETYQNETFGFDFQYPKNFIVKLYELCSAKDPYCTLELSLKITNPSLPKKVYDCCYTPEEIEQYGEIPPIMLKVLKKDPITYGFYPESQNKVVEEIITLGVPKELASDPTLDIAPPALVDSCSAHQVSKINGNIVVKSSGCTHEGVFETQLFTVIDGKDFQNNVLQFDYKANDYDAEIEKILETLNF